MPSFIFRRNRVQDLTLEMDNTQLMQSHGKSRTNGILYSTQSIRNYQVYWLYSSLFEGFKFHLPGYRPFGGMISPP